MTRNALAVASAAAWSVATALVVAQGDGNRVSVPFSDPSRPGTVQVNLFHGSIRVTASNGREVVVTTDDPIVTARDGREAAVPQPPEAAGLRRLTQRNGVRIEEANNVMTIGSGRFMGRFTGDESVQIEVPARTNLNLSTVSGNMISVEGVEGEIEATSMAGDIRLRDVAGTVVAHAMSGDMFVWLRQVLPDKPMSFTSFKGNVDVTLPANVKANFKLRSDQGEVYTDFDVQIQQRTASTSVQVPPVPPAPPALPVPPGSSPNPRPRPGQRSPRATRIDVDSSIYGTVNGGGPEFELRTFNGNVYLRKGK
jgi:hypothetical protein